jgi:hypothetical protein
VAAKIDSGRTEVNTKIVRCHQSVSRPRRLLHVADIPKRGCRSARRIGRRPQSLLESVHRLNGRSLTIVRANITVGSPLGLLPPGASCHSVCDRIAVPSLLTIVNAEDPNLWCILEQRRRKRTSGRRRAKRERSMLGDRASGAAGDRERETLGAAFVPCVPGAMSHDLSGGPLLLLPELIEAAHCRSHGMRRGWRRRERGGCFRRRTRQA